MNNILNSKTSTKEDKELVLKAQKSIAKSVIDYKLPKWRFHPVIDFKLKTFFVWLD